MWELVSADHMSEIHRMPVPSGWLYREKHFGFQMITMCFVPAPQNQPQQFLAESVQEPVEITKTQLS